MAEFAYKRNSSRQELDHDDDTPAKDTREAIDVPAIRSTKFGTYARASTMAKVPVRRELVQDLIPLGSVGFIGGQSGAFKTFFALDLAAEIATGGSIAGKRVFRAGGVVVLAYEGQGTLDERWAAICRDKRLRGFPPVFLVREAKPLSTEAAWADLHSMLLDIRDDLRGDGTELQLLVIDTVNMSGMVPDDKENDAGAWGGIFTVLTALARSMGCSVALVHHAGKDVQAGLRGSSAAHAAADFVIMCETERDPVSGEVSNRWLHLRKSRFGKEGPIAQMSSESVPVTINEFGESVSTLVMRYDTEAIYAPAPRDGKRPAGQDRTEQTDGETQLLKVCADLVGDEDAGLWPDRVGGEHVPRAIIPEFLAREAFLKERGVTGDGNETAKNTARKAFNRARERLVKRGFIEAAGGGLKLLK